MACPCEICARYQRFRMVMSSGSRVKLRQLARAIFDELYSVEEDLEYKNAILDGSWPTAVEHLEEALRAAKAKKAMKEKTCPELSQQF